MVVDSPFNVTSTGSFAHGSTLTITRSSGTFPPRQYGNSPWLYDTVDHQYLNGTDQNAYAGFTDGQDTAHLLYTKQTSDWGVPDAMKWWTSKTKRTTYQNAVYATVMTVNNGKATISNPPWPYGGSQNNLTLYSTFWGMSVNPFQTGTGGGTGACKINRMVDLNNQGAPSLGINAWSSGSPGYGSNANPAGQSDFTGWRVGNAGVWMRHEFWMEIPVGPSRYSTGGQLMDGWNGTMGGGQKYKFRNWSGFGGQYVSCHPVDAMYSPANLRTDSWWDTTATNLGVPFSALSINYNGYDDSGTLSGGVGGSAGNIYSISEMYMDPDLWRIELGDKLSWDASPTSTMNREICGHWSRNSDTQITVQLNFGQFTPGSTVALYLVNTTDRQNAIRICHN